MPTYLSVERTPVSVSCYQCGAEFAFLSYDKILEATCTGCKTPLFLPHELEGIARK
jgi:hypothetical protein